MEVTSFPREQSLLSTSDISYITSLFTSKPRYAKFITLQTFTRDNAERLVCLCAGIRTRVLQLHETYSRGQGRCSIVADKKEGPDSDGMRTSGDYHTMLALHAERTIEPTQASSTLYLLRVVTVVTLVTIVPKSSRLDSARWVRVEDCPVSSPSYGGGNPCSPVSFGERGSTFTGINFHINKGSELRPPSGVQHTI